VDSAALLRGRPRRAPDRRRADLRRAGQRGPRAHPELFQRGFVAGVPPDRYSDRGQLWGNPLYDWPALCRRRYRWWTERLRRTFELFDLARIDHFRGFVAYWSVPEGAPDARGGRWRRGPGGRRSRRPIASSALCR
jgi:4-alpha-glucanotransferase